MFLSFWLDDNEVTNVADTDMNMNASVSKPSSKSKSSTSTRATKKEDDGRPRRPRSSYNFFFQMQREAIMKQQKQVPIVVHKSIKTSSKVDAVKVDDVTQTEGSLDFFSAAVAFVTPDVAPKTIVSNANANAASYANGFPALPFKDNASSEEVSKAVSTSPLSFTMCAPCNSNIPSAGDVSLTESSSVLRWQAP